MRNFKKHIEYDPIQGLFRRKIAFHTAKKGWWKGTKQPHGYRTICLGSKKYYAHQIAWFLSHGVFPKFELDHINGDRSDNRICNLRKSTRMQNAANLKRQRINNTSGYKGVHWNKKLYNWRARITFGYKTFSIGSFSSKEKAAKAYDYQAEILFGEYASLNFPRVANA